MTWSETPNNDFSLPQEPNKNIKFTKNAEGQRVPEYITDAELEEKKKNNTIGMVVVGMGAIEHIHAEIFNILNSNKIKDIKGDVIVLGNEDAQRYLWPERSLEEILKKMPQEPIIIEARPMDDMSDLIHLEKSKAYPHLKKQYPAPKPQKSKAKQIKGYRQKRK